MKFRTEIEPKNGSFEINHQTAVFCLGSCFSDVIGSFLSENKFHCLRNPFGTVFNLKSIEKLFDYALGLKNIDDQLFTSTDDIFFHHDFHSEISAVSKDLLKIQIEEKCKFTGDFLQKADVIVLTLGTSWVYQHVEYQNIVSNCHKKPSVIFEKKLLEISEQLDIFESIYNNLKKINSNVKVLLTVSPVRHTKDSLELNAVSKSFLRSVTYELTRKYHDVEYFPAFEIMIDDLRDYRFYKEDLIHPTEVAEKYILGKFSEKYFSEKTQKIILEWQKIKNALNHRPFNPQSQAHLSFLKKTKEKIKEFSEYFNTADEQELIQKVLKSQN
ncbi:MAG: GSCFA domain-containing protein [Cytophagaceae bacterium]|nr:GSCFA domain-containing protein [Cytophagaceae bacterium]